MKILSFGRKPHGDWMGFFAPRFILLVVALGLLLRLALAFQPITIVDWGFWRWLGILGLGVLNDTAFAVVALAPSMVLYALLTPLKYRSPYKWIILTILVALWAYACWVPNNLLWQHSGGLQRVARIVLTALLALWAARMWWPRLRRPLRLGVVYAVMYVYVLLTVFDIVAEWQFWAEFGARYNFVAVDYLVYTNEVVGNIMESYPMGWIIASILLVSGLIYWLMIRRWRPGEMLCPRLLPTFGLYIVAAAVSLWWLSFAYWHLKAENAFVSELQENGCYDFIQAFQANEIDYSRYYAQLPEEDVTKVLDGLGNDCDTLMAVAQRPNIVLVMVESLSASYLQAYGNTDGLTPNIDSLLQRSLAFDSLFAAGNRSVRGLEAVTLCRPPSAGESLIKRPQQPRRHNIGQVLRQNGYLTQFIYGGNSYFDNMGPFFRSQGYEVVDASRFGPGEISFKTIWGACDGDAYAKALKEADNAYKEGRPFFQHIMTISNHRPFTYPPSPGLPDGERGRAQAVRYTDYALGRYIREASQKPWGRNTLFVIVADHCASSAGSTTLPLDKYHIPAIVHAPGLITPQRIGTVCSQIDLMPTVLSLAGVPLQPQMTGRNILSPCYIPRAFIATYQDLAYYRDGLLTILSPQRRIRQFGESLQPDGTYLESPIPQPDSTLQRQAQAFYQKANTRP